MLIQIALGSLFILATVLLAALSFWGLDAFLRKIHDWLVRAPHGPRLVLVLTLTMLWTVFMMTASVWVWAFAFWWLDIFATLEAAVYFSLVAFTTLGFGDVLLPQEWRLLSGLAAANGLLVFGLLAAMLLESLRQTRQRQRGEYDDYG